MRYQYLNEKSPRYNTLYTHFCSTVLAAENSFATLQELDTARWAIANRADWLMGRQRKHYCQNRAQNITSLQKAYDHIISRMITMGWN